MRHRRVRSRSRERERKRRSRSRSGSRHSRSRSRDRASKKRHKKEKKRKHKDKKEERSSRRRSRSVEKGGAGEGERVDKFGRTLPAGRERSPSLSSVQSLPSSKGSRSRSPSEARQRWWGHDKYMEVRDVDDEDEVRKRLPLDYVPPQPTWKSKAGGVYIPLKK